MDLSEPQLTAKPVSTSHRETWCKRGICVRLHRGGHRRQRRFQQGFTFIEAVVSLGLSTNTKLNLSGNSQFTGAIYAPNADFNLGGGGSEVYDFIGSSVTKSVTLNGHYNFHYDEQLEKSGPMRVLVVTSWNEI